MKIFVSLSAYLVVLVFAFARASFANGFQLTNNTYIFSTLEFTIGEGSMIQGWDQGLLDMCVGEVRELITPSSYAYGDLPVGDAIPPKAHLVFYIELLDIKDGQPKPDIFGQVDVNGDGLISHDEVCNAVVNKRTKLFLNGRRQKKKLSVG